MFCSGVCRFRGILTSFKQSKTNIQPGPGFGGQARSPYQSVLYYCCLVPQPRPQVRILLGSGRIACHSERDCVLGDGHRNNDIGKARNGYGVKALSLYEETKKAGYDRLDFGQCRNR